MSYAEDVMNDPLHYFHNLKPVYIIPRNQVNPMQEWFNRLQEYKFKKLAEFLFDEKETKQERGLLPTHTSPPDDKKEG